MAQQSPWSLIDPKKVAALGAKALASGQISPEEAQAHADSLGLSGGDNAQANSIAMSNQNPTGPLDMNADAPPSPQTQKVLNAQQAYAHVTGAFSKNEKDDTSKRVRSMNRVLTKTPEQIQAEQMMASGYDLSDAITGYKPAVDEQGVPIPGFTDESQPIYDLSRAKKDPNSPVTQQEQGLERMQDLLKMQSDANMKRNTMDFTPLAALADARNAEVGRPTNLAATVEKPADHTQQFMAFADEIQKRRADIQKAIYENQRNMRGGSALDQLTQAMMLKNSEGFGSPTMANTQAKIDQSQWNRAHMAHTQLMTMLNKDPMTRTQLGAFNTLSNAFNLLGNTQITPQLATEVQRKIMQAMSMTGGNGQTLGDERAQMYLKDIGQDADRVIQYFEGKPVNISKNDPIVKHIQKMALIEQQSIAQQRSARVEETYPGFGWIYEPDDQHPNGRWPDLTRAAEAEKAALTKTTSGTGATIHSKSAESSGGMKSNYDGSTPLQAGFTADQKAARLKYLQAKAAN